MSASRYLANPLDGMFASNPQDGHGYYVLHYARGRKVGVTDFKGPYVTKSKATDHIPYDWERRYLIKRLTAKQAMAMAFQVHENSQ